VHRYVGSLFHIRLKTHLFRVPLDSA
jgi:hypothetical protein